MECSWDKTKVVWMKLMTRARVTEGNMAKLKTKPRTKNITKLTDVAKTH